MHGAPDKAIASQRARWLDELISAIQEAQKLAWRLGVAEGDCDEARQLYGRLEAVRDEIDLLRSGEWVLVWKEIDPIWRDKLLGGLGPPENAGKNQHQTPSGRSPPPAKS